MKFFKGGITLTDHDNKWNWVDENNVVLGYSNLRDCCESFGYRYDLEVPKNLDGLEDGTGIQDPNLKTYRFDPSFCSQATGVDDDGGGTATFRLVGKDMPDLYLTIWNYHNGYYSHGFSLTQFDKNFHTGSL